MRIGIKINGPTRFRGRYNTWKTALKFILDNSFSHGKHWTQDEKQLSLRMMKTWTDFAREGRPKNIPNLNPERKGIKFMVPIDQEIDLTKETDKIEFHKKYMFPTC